MDAVSDRDFAIEIFADSPLPAMHLSRLAEDLILWAGSEFNFITIADAYTTGSASCLRKRPRYGPTDPRQKPDASTASCSPC